MGRIHRPDLFMVVLRDALGTSAPQSVRKLARRLRLNKYTIWRWRMPVFSIIDSSAATSFSGIVEADETYGGSRARGPANGSGTSQMRRKLYHRPARWEDFATQGLKMMRDLSKWQPPILTVTDRGGARLFRRLPDCKVVTLERAMKPLVPSDAALCSDGANGSKNLAAAGGIEHFVVGSKTGTRVTSGCYHIQNVNSLHALYDRLIRPFCGPATKNRNGYIRWLEARLTGMRPTEVVRASKTWCRGKGLLRVYSADCCGTLEYRQ